MSPEFVSFFDVEIIFMPFTLQMCGLGEVQMVSLFLAHLSRRLKVRYCDRSSCSICLLSPVNYFLKRHLLDHWSKFKITSHECSP